MEQENVTIVCVPRDHFSDAIESLDSIYENSDRSFSLVYVDGASPRPVAKQLKEQAARRGFTLIRTEEYLSPNRARNIGAADVQTEYLVFIDNDVIVAPGWLGPLVECAEQTGAALVSPLNFERRPVHTHVHFAGGEARVDVTEAHGRTERHIVDKIRKRNIPVQPSPTGCAEFHCVLARTSVFRAIGGLDEQMLSTRENLDFCMTIKDAGYQIMLEPVSKITYLPPERMRLSDVPYFALRWSDEWDRASFRHFRDKWNLTEDEYFAKQYRVLGWRRRSLMMQGALLQWLPSWKMRKLAERLLRPLERRLNRLISGRYAARHLQPEGG